MPSFVISKQANFIHPREENKMLKQKKQQIFLTKESMWKVNTREISWIKQTSKLLTS